MVTFEVFSFRMYTSLHTYFPWLGACLEVIFQNPIQSNRLITFNLVSVVKMLPFERVLDSVEQKEVAGGKIWWVEWCSTTVIFFLAKNSFTRKAESAGALSWHNRHELRHIYGLFFRIRSRRRSKIIM
jgi:hypothetical protein